jgi:aspartate dehydrogenase
MRLGLIGCGSIGSRVASEIARGAIPGVEVAGLADPRCSPAARRLAESTGAPLFADVDLLLALQPAVVLEAASVDAVRCYGRAILESGADLIVVSVGAFADSALFARLTEIARAKRGRLLVPSGAIGGIDMIRAAAVGGIDECTLTTTKPPGALNSTLYIREMGIDLDAIRQPTVIFEGSAAQAVRHFPQNLNVSVTISLAGIGLERTTVRVIADPAATRNTHEVFVRGAFGEATVRLVNVPSPENPRSSSLASYSVIAMLHGLSREFCLGT